MAEATTGLKRARGGSRPGSGRKKKDSSADIPETHAHKLARKAAAAQHRRDLGSQLLSAVEFGNVEVVCELLDDGADVNYSATRGGSTALSEAAHYCNPGVIAVLVSRGAQVSFSYDCHA
jgi:ankyrin repeat protein